ncbi:MAG: B12-binding domain-containing protein [Actinobacteria bacterium]|nr:B12-binding domain-containing protein [Actinomycetota bacterium]
MNREEILAKLASGVSELEPEVAAEAAHEAKAAGITVVDAIQEGLSKGMNIISDLFDEGEMFVPQIIIAAEAFQGAVEILTEGMTADERGAMSRGKVICHTVQGDIHDVGKNIVKTMFAANGFEVIDMGRDVPVDDVVAKAKAENVDIVTGSALMTTTMPAQREIVNGLIEIGIRDNVKCLFGGAPVSQEWVDKIGADGYADNAADAVKVAIELVSG